jgi:hypothetical protein
MSVHERDRKPIMNARLNQHDMDKAKFKFKILIGYLNKFPDDMLIVHMYTDNV